MDNLPVLKGGSFFLTCNLHSQSIIMNLLYYTYFNKNKSFLFIFIIDVSNYLYRNKIMMFETQVNRSLQA